MAAVSQYSTNHGTTTTMQTMTKMLRLHLLLLAAALWDRARGHEIPVAMRAWPPAVAIALHVVIAVLYTTIWDNYLVATRVWWYDPALVTGVTLAYVPIGGDVRPMLFGLATKQTENRSRIVSVFFEHVRDRVQAGSLPGLSG